LRVDTLISIRFMAQQPSQSSACGGLNGTFQIRSRLFAED
jgi:hypothetical protein